MSAAFGLSIDDRALAIAVDGRVLGVAPAIVYRTGGKELGTPAVEVLRSRPAEASARHWSDIATEGAASVAALPIAAAELRQRMRTAEDALRATGDGQWAAGDGLRAAGQSVTEAAWVAVGATFRRARCRTCWPWRRPLR